MLFALFCLIMKMSFNETPDLFDRFLDNDNLYSAASGFDLRYFYEKEDDILLRDIGLNIKKKEWLKMLKDPNVSILTKIDFIEHANIMNNNMVNKNIFDDILEDWEFDIE